MSKTTPGPWMVRKVHPGRSNTPMLQVVPEPGNPGQWAVAQIVRGTRSYLEREGNASLIAAAPDLLEAAKRALTFLRDNGMSHGNDLARAIAKAEGR